MPKLILTTPVLEINSGRFVVKCQSQDARYHAWLNDDLAIELERRMGSGNREKVATIYKNPPAGTEHNSPADFKTRYLTDNKGEGKIVAAHMLANLEVQRAAALAKVAEEKAAEERKYAAQARQNRIEAEAHEMYKLVEEMVRGDGTADSLQRSLDMANAVLRRVEQVAA